MGKRCIALDMGSDKGRAVMRRLIAGADVVVANFSPGALRHFGLDYDSLRAIKDDIILTTASAYHSEGPLAERIGFDGVGQAVSGAIWLSGLPGQPFRSATAFVDFGTALSCAYGTLGAIIRKMRTGKGSLVEASLVGTAMAIMNQILIEEATGYNHRVPTGNRSPIAGPSDVFMARDGWFIMQVIGGRMFHRWCKPGRPAEPARRSPLCHRYPARQERRGAQPDHGRMVGYRTREECLNALIAANIGCGPVLSPAEVIAGQMGLTDTFMRKVDYPGSDGIPVAHAPAHLSEGTVAAPSRPPLLGEHTEQVLAEYGLAEAEIAALKAAGVIRT